jgi:hypothetical protein
MRIEIPLTYSIHYRQRRHRNFETVAGLVRRTFEIPDMDSRGQRQVALLLAGPDPGETFHRLSDGPTAIVAAEGALWRAALRENEVATAADAGIADPRNPFVAACAEDGLRWNVAFDARRRQIVRPDGRRYDVDPAEVRDDGGEADATLMARHVAENLRMKDGVLYVRTSEPCIEVGRSFDGATIMSLRETDADFSRPSSPRNDLHHRHIEEAITLPTTRWRLDRLDEAREEAGRAAGAAVDPRFAVLEFDASALRFCDDAWHVIRAAHYAEGRMMDDPVIVPLLPFAVAGPLFALRDACDLSGWRATRPMFEALGRLADALPEVDPERLRDSPPRNLAARHFFHRAGIAWPDLHARLSRHVGYAHARWRERAVSPLEWIGRGGPGVVEHDGRRAIEILTLEDAAKGAFEARCPEALSVAEAAARAEARLFATLDGENRVAAFGVRACHGPAPIEPLGRARLADLAAMEALAGLEGAENEDTAAFAALAT